MAERRKDTEEGPCEDRAEIGGMRPQARSPQKLDEAGRTLR